MCIKIYNRQLISLDPDSDRAVFIWATIPEIPRQTSDKKIKRATKSSSNCPPAGTTALCWRSPGVVKKLWRRDEKVLYGTSSFLTPTKGNALRIFLPPTSKDCLFGFFLNCLDLDSHFELLHFFIFQSGGRLTSYHVTLKRCFCPQTSSIWIPAPKCQKWLGFSMLVVLLRRRHCMLAITVFYWLICIVSMMILLLSVLTFCNSNPWIQFSGSKFKRFLFEICQRRSNPPWQGSCPGQEPTFPTTGPDVLLLLLQRITIKITTKSILKC